MKMFSLRSIMSVSALFLLTACTRTQAATDAAQVHWLEGQVSEIQQGTAFGVPWPKGLYPQGTEFTLRTEDGRELPMQTWKTATWPDGSLKWTGHAVAPGVLNASTFDVVAGKPVAPASPVKVKQTTEAVVVDTGVIQCTLPLNGNSLISEVIRDGKAMLVDGRLTGMRQDAPDRGVAVEPFTSQVQKVTIEQDGPVRAVVKVEGVHKTAAGREWLPFSVRLYFFAGSDSIRMAHTFIFDGDEYKDFICGLGVRFNVPMRDEFYNRHVRFAGQDGGVFGEAVQGLTGLRRDPGEAVRKAQVAGEKVPDIRTWDPRVSTRVHWIPTWGDYSLTQPNVNGFVIRKRTKEGCGWLPSAQGGRSAGMGYIGGVSGGVEFGMRDFWKLYPTQLDIRNAATDQAEVTLWIWSPDAGPMDIRFYHDGMGQDVEGPIEGVKIEGIDTSVPDRAYAKQLDALNITYEDYEPGFGTPHGVARTTDLYFKVVGATPTRTDFMNVANEVALPPQLVPSPKRMIGTKVFGTMLSLPNRSTPQLARIEDKLDWLIDMYQKEVDQRSWYGFWDYGDVMHTYDPDRHVWRYDVGGFAWDNSELSSDMWIWSMFLRSGNPAAFRMGEAMNRHNRDVDIYHLGRFAGMGTRHNVMHWGCSAKQLRISTCMNRRYHYYLTTDERTGDVLEEVVESDRQLAEINPVRKLPGQPFKASECRMSPGTDYGAAVANWLTAWERTGDEKYRNWIVNSMRDIATSKWGFFTDAFQYDPVTKKMTAPDAPPAVYHLSIMFGLPEVCSELIELVDMPEFKEAWLKYCAYSQAPDAVQEEVLGTRLRKYGFNNSQSRIIAYAAAMKDDQELAKVAANYFPRKLWQEPNGPRAEKVEAPNVLNPIEEAWWMSTNDSAQWSLAAIEIIALIPDALDDALTEE